MGDTIFHLAFPVNDLEETKRFYVNGLGCLLGRTSANALTLALAGNQIVAHLTKEKQERQKNIYPRHFGLIFTKEKDWQILVDRARAKGLRFYREPKRRFEGSRIEHLTFFLEDPSCNILEFKHYKHDSAIFGEQHLSRVGEMDEKER